MTAQQIEAPAPPYIELHSAPLSEEQKLLLTATNASADPAEAWRHALTAHRIIIINEVRKRLSVEKVLSEGVIRDVLDLVWQINVPFLQKVTGPMIAEAYLSAFRKANAGDVPIKMIYSLAEEHARRTGDYFNSTSTDALVQGFNTYVNRQVPEKAAIERVLDAYGLTPRQMSGLTSAKQFETKANTSVPQKLKNKIKRYIGKSISNRLDLFTRQESHNLNEQAQQVAWMWMMDHGKLPRTAEKMWLTAKDERVCPICGPLHRTKVPVGDRFLLDDGQKLYVPGAHPNCRCTVRLQINPFEVVGKSAFGIITKADDDFDPEEHPRGTGGRFVRAAAEPAPPVAEREADQRVADVVAEAARVAEEERATRQQELEEQLEAARSLERARRIQERLAERRKARNVRLSEGSEQRVSLSGATEPMRLGGLTEPVQQGQALAGDVSLSGAGQLSDVGEGLSGMAPAEEQRVMDQPLMASRENAPLGSQMGRLVPKPLRRREVLTHIVPLGVPYHAIGSMSEVNTDDSKHPFGTVQLNYNMNFSSVEAPIKGGEIAADILERKVEEVIANNRQTLIEPDFANPNQNLYYTVDQDDIESAIHQYAFQNINDKGFTPTPFTIEWRTSNNVPRKEETITYPELAEKMGVTPEDLEVVVFRVEEGHEDKTVEDALGVVPTMKLEGNFYVEKDNTLTREAMDQTDEALHTPTGTRALPIRVLTLRPIATPTIREHDINPNEPELLDE